MKVQLTPLTYEQKILPASLSLSGLPQPASSLLALSSHPRALAVAVRTPRRDFSPASRGPSPGPEHVPDFFPCSLAPAAADMPCTAEPMAFGAGDEVVGAALEAEAGGAPGVWLVV